MAEFIKKKLNQVKAWGICRKVSVSKLAKTCGLKTKAVRTEELTNNI